MDLSVSQDEAEGCLLCPIAVVVGGTIGRGEEGAVAAVFSFEQGDVGIGCDLVPGFVCEADEGIVAGVEDEGGDDDVVEDAGGGGAEVVVIGGTEAGVEGGDAVVELAERRDVGGALGIEGAREEHGLAAKALEQSAEELAFIDAVVWFVESVGGGSQIDCRGDADDRVKLWRCGGAEVAGELENQVSAHGVANEGYGLEVLGGDEVAKDVIDVGGEAGVVEGGGEARHVSVITSAAVAHVHTDDVAAGEPELVRVADDVLGPRGAFEAVEDDRGGTGRTVGEGLPIALAQDLGSDLRAVRGRNLDELRGGRG